MSIPAAAIIEPDVIIVGNAKFSVSIMASRFGIVSLTSRNRLEMTIA